MGKLNTQNDLKLTAVLIIVSPEEASSLEDQPSICKVPTGNCISLFYKLLNPK